MATINSVLGPMDTADLGFTLPHEHVTTGSAGVQDTYPELIISRERAIEMAAGDLTRARNEGVGTIVDLTTLDLGRNVRLMEEVSRRSGVHIICATGSWLDVPRAFWTLTPDRVADLWVREIEEGIEGTGIKPGIIKVATSSTMTGQEELMLRAAADAHRRTGLPISTHTPPLSRVGQDHLRILEVEGVDPARVYVGHVNSTPDKGYHAGLMEKGAFLGMDHYFWCAHTEPAGLARLNNAFQPYKHIPGYEIPGWEERTVLVKELIDDGYADRIMLSHDWIILRRGGQAATPPGSRTPMGSSGSPEACSTT